MRRLSMKQELFAHAYIKNLGNGTASVREAYPNIKTEKARWVMAAKLVRNDKVQAKISELSGSIWEEKISLIEGVLRELKNQFYSAKEPRDKDKIGRTLLEVFQVLGGAGNKTAVVVMNGSGEMDLDKMSVADLHTLRAAVDEKIGGRGVWTEMLMNQAEGQEQTS